VIIFFHNESLRCGSVRGIVRGITVSARQPLSALPQLLRHRRPQPASSCRRPASRSDVVIQLRCWPITAPCVTDDHRWRHLGGIPAPDDASSAERALRSSAEFSARLDSAPFKAEARSALPQSSAVRRRGSVGRSNVSPGGYFRAARRKISRNRERAQSWIVRCF